MFTNMLKFEQNLFVRKIQTLNAKQFIGRDHI